MKLRTLMVFLMAVSFSLGAERPLAPWPPPEGPLRVIVDTDTANEVDDQFALALALGSRGRLRIEGFVAAHFGGAGGAGGIEASYAELQKVLKLAGMAGELPVKRGSDPLVYPDRVPESEGVDFIIERARAATPDDPLWLVLLGPATDAAAALMKAPEIADRLVLFWHGRTRWPVQCWNFNAYNDIKAVQIIFERPCRLVLFDTGTYLRMPWEEMERRIAPIGPLGRHLFDIRVKKAWTKSPSKGFFDLGDLAALVDPAAVEFEQVAAPRRPRSGLRFLERPRTDHPHLRGRPGAVISDAGEGAVRHRAARHAVTGGARAVSAIKETALPVTTTSSALAGLRSRPTNIVKLL